jgi:hypothetical protein
MRNLIYATCLLDLAVWFSGAAALGQSAKPPLANDDVIQMVTNGLPESVVIGAISANDVNFDASTGGLLALRKASVGDKVIEAMLAAQAKTRDVAAQRAVASQTQAAAQLQAMYLSGGRMGTMGMPGFDPQAHQAPAETPKVSLVVGDKKQVLQPSSTEIANAKGKGGSVAGGILKGFGKTVLMAGNMTGAPVPRGGFGGGAGIPGTAHSWALPGRTSSFLIPTASPKFEIEFADIPGVDPDAYEPVLVQLIQTKDNWRLVSSSKDKFDKHGNDTRSVKTEDKTPLNINVLGRGHLQVSPVSALSPGEYGLVLHTKKSVKELAGTPANNTEVIFSSVWDFSVKAGPISPAGQK